MSEALNALQNVPNIKQENLTTTKMESSISTSGPSSLSSVGIFDESSQSNSIDRLLKWVWPTILQIFNNFLNNFLKKNCFRFFEQFFLTSLTNRLRATVSTDFSSGFGQQFYKFLTIFWTIFLKKLFSIFWTIFLKKIVFDFLNNFFLHLWRIVSEQQYRQTSQVGLANNFTNFEQFFWKNCFLFFEQFFWTIFSYIFDESSQSNSIDRLLKWVWPTILQILNNFFEKIVFYFLNNFFEHFFLTSLTNRLRATVSTDFLSGFGQQFLLKKWHQ